MRVYDHIPCNYDTAHSYLHTASLTAFATQTIPNIICNACRLLGSEVTYQAIARGEDVVALCRTPSKLTVPAGSGGSKAGEPLQDSKITVIQGSATNQADVDKVFATGGVTGVVVALGGKSKDVGATMLTDATTCIIKGMLRFF
jgi:hypothetical protein